MARSGDSFNDLERILSRLCLRHFGNSEVLVDDKRVGNDSVLTSLIGLSQYLRCSGSDFLLWILLLPQLMKSCKGSNSLLPYKISSNASFLDFDLETLEFIEFFKVDDWDDASRECNISHANLVA